MAAQKWQVDSVGQQFQVRAKGDLGWVTVLISPEGWTSFQVGGRSFSALEDRPGHICITTAVEKGDQSVGLSCPNPGNARGEEVRLVDTNFYLRLPQTSGRSADSRICLHRVQAQASRV